MTKTVPTPAVRKQWVRPAVQKIAAGQAEAGTRSSRDAMFAQS